MHSYNGLFDHMTQLDELEDSTKSAAKYKRKRKQIIRVLNNIENECRNLQEKLLNGTWYPKRHRKEGLQEGSHKKKREIEKPCFRYEQIVHHALIKELRPILEPRMYEYTYGSLPDKGNLAAVRAMVKWRDGYRGRKFYVAELDIRKFYASINTEILKDRLRRLIRDKRYLEIMFRVIDAGSPGIPLGFYTSPWLGHLYFLPIDNYIVQELKPDHYLRYADNLFLFHTSKRKLHKIVESLSAKLATVDLEFNGSRQIYRFEYVDRRDGKVHGRAINALGYVIHHNRVTMRKSILKRARAKANRMGKTRRIRRIDAAAMISYCGWFKHSNTYNYFQKYIKPKVSIRACRKRIAAISRKEKR